MKSKYLSEEKIEKLFEEFCPLIEYLARRFAEDFNVSFSYIDDLVFAGQSGLYKAFEGFNPGERVNFSTFANKHIKGRMYDELESLGFYRPIKDYSFRQKEISEGLIAKLRSSDSALISYIKSKFSEKIRNAIVSGQQIVDKDFIVELNKIIESEEVLYDPDVFKGISFTEELKKHISVDVKKLSKTKRTGLNRSILEEIFPGEIIKKISSRPIRVDNTVQGNDEDDDGEIRSIFDVIGKADMRRDLALLSIIIQCCRSDAGLTEKQRRAFRYYMIGFNLKEIAEKIEKIEKNNIDESGAKQRLTAYNKGRAGAIDKMIYCVNCKIGEDYLGET